MAEHDRSPGGVGAVPSGLERDAVAGLDHSQRSSQTTEATTITRAVMREAMIRYLVCTLREATGRRGEILLR